MTFELKQDVEKLKDEVEVLKEEKEFEATRHQEEIEELREKQEAWLEKAKREMKDAGKYIFDIKNRFEGEHLISAAALKNLNLIFLAYHPEFREWVAEGNHISEARVTLLEECMGQDGFECPQLDDIPPDKRQFCRGISWYGDPISDEWIHFCVNDFELRRWHFSDISDSLPNMDEVDLGQLHVQYQDFEDGIPEDNFV